MSKQVPWNRKILDMFIAEAMLSDDEIYIMESRIKGIPISVQADYLSVSESSVHRMISRLKKKYDSVQKHHPDEMPPRKFSAQETWWIHIDSFMTVFRELIERLALYFYAIIFLKGDGIMNNFQISDLINLAKGDPQTMYEKMMKENRQFSEFVEKNKSRKPEDIAKDYGIDPTLLSLFIR